VLLPSIVSCRNLVILSLNYLRLSDRAAHLLGQHLTTFHALKGLLVRGNSFSFRGTSVVTHAGMLAPALTTLDLSTNHASLANDTHPLPDSDAPARLELLALSAIQLGVVGAHWLRGILPKMRFLHTLQLDRNRLRDTDMVYICAGLCSCKMLATLKLSFNDLTHFGVQCMHPVLQACSGLTSLSLGRNRLGPTGVVSLMHGLRPCTRLVSLGLNHNHIGDGGVLAIVEAHPLLYVKSLELAQNMVTHRGGAALASWLRGQSSLTYLGLVDNFLRRPTHEMLRAAAEEREGPRLILEVDEEVLAWTDSEDDFV
tara:strand:- start:21 stop:959 length:939 start_codon:yes stop_codon:yes gene_type:complete